MIVKIENENIVVEEYGLAPGTYPIDALTVEELDKERSLLHIRFFRELSESDARKLGDLVEQISKLIDKKFRDIDYKVKDYLGYNKVKVSEINKAVLDDINKNLGKG